MAPHRHERKFFGAHFCRVTCAKEQKKGENAVKVLLAGTGQDDIRFRAEKEPVIDWYEDVMIEENEKKVF